MSSARPSRGPRRPPRSTARDRVSEAAALSLLLERLPDTSPSTLVLAMRQHQQHLVPEADGVVDCIADFGADFHILRRKPAAHALALKVGVQPLRQLLVFAGVADEAGVKLNRLSTAPPVVANITTPRTRMSD